MTVVREPEAIRIGRQAAPLRAPGVFCLRVSASFQARVPSGGLPPGGHSARPWPCGSASVRLPCLYGEVSAATPARRRRWLPGTLL